MATVLSRSWPLFKMESPDAITQSLQAASADDVVVVTVLAILSAVYLLRGTLWDLPDPYLYKMYERPQEKMGSNSLVTASRDVAERMHQLVSKVTYFMTTNSY
jgi:NADPH-ferrihemoprotein reductase